MKLKSCIPPACAVMVAGTVTLPAAGCFHESRAPEPVASDPAATAGYRLLADGRFYPGSPPPHAVAVIGELRSGMFVPHGAVQGGDLDTPKGSPAWMELTSGSIYPSQTARAPVSPYVEGVLTPEGTFVPSSRQLH